MRTGQRVRVGAVAGVATEPLLLVAVVTSVLRRGTQNTCEYNTQDAVVSKQDAIVGAKGQTGIPASLLPSHGCGHTHTHTTHTQHTYTHTAVPTLTTYRWSELYGFANMVQAAELPAVCMNRTLGSNSNTACSTQHTNTHTHTHIYIHPHTASVEKQVQQTSGGWLCMCLRVMLCEALEHSDRPRGHYTSALHVPAGRFVCCSVIVPCELMSNSCALHPRHTVQFGRCARDARLLPCTQTQHRVTHMVRGVCFLFFGVHDALFQARGALRGLCSVPYQSCAAYLQPPGCSWSALTVP